MNDPVRFVPPGNQWTNMPVNLSERCDIYGDAYQLTGIVMQPIADKVYQSLLLDHPRMFTCWFMILNKLMRLLKDPTHADSWADIVGYAQLALEQRLPNPERTKIG